MQLGSRGLDLIKRYETFRSTAYLPTPDDVWTIGYGHTKNVRKGDTCTLEQAEQWLRDDVSSAVKAVNRLVVKVSLTQSMFDALVSLVFNVGTQPVTTSSIIGRSLLAGDYYKGWQSFALWRKQAGKDLLGLARRRAEEMTLFLRDGLPNTVNIQETD